MGDNLGDIQQRRTPTERQYDETTAIYPEYLAVVKRLLEDHSIPLPSRYVLVQIAAALPTGYEHITADVLEMLSQANLQTLQNFGVERKIIGNTRPSYVLDTSGNISMKNAPEACLADILLDRTVSHTDEVARERLIEVFLRSMRDGKKRGAVENSVQNLLIGREGYFSRRLYGEPESARALYDKFWTPVGERLVDPDISSQDAGLLAELLEQRAYFDRDLRATRILVTALGRTQRPDVLHEVFWQTALLAHNFERDYGVDTESSAFTQDLFRTLAPIIARRIPNLQDPADQLYGLYVLSIAKEQLGALGIQINNFRSIWDDILQNRDKLIDSNPQGWTGRFIDEIENRRLFT